MFTQEPVSAAGEVRFTATATMGDIVWTSAAIARRSTLGVAIGTAMFALALVSLLLGAGSWVLVPLALLGLSFVTGFIMVPFAWLATRRNREAQLAPTAVHATAERIRMESAGSEVSSPWSAYRRASETSRAYLLDPDTGLVLILAKRGVDADALDAFRELLLRADLLSTASAGRRLLSFGLAAMTGLAVAAVMVGLPVAMTIIQANARIDLSVRVAHGIANVVGSTDLPDGTLIAVDVYQADEWRRHAGEATDDAVDSFPWIDGDDVTVVDGAFEATIDIGGWPPGNGGAVAEFWVDGAQPPEVHERFGADGSDLRGPGVGEFDDGTPRLRAHTFFDIP